MRRSMRGAVFCAAKIPRRGNVRFLLVLLLTAIPARAAETNWIPKPDEVSRLEKKLVLPERAGPLNDYARYYWGATENGVEVIHGALSFGPRQGVHLVAHAPPKLLTDQGCRWINIRYEPATDKIEAQCDGLA